jgi:hypothetical protein
MKSESKIQQEIYWHYWNTYCLPIHNPRCMIFHIPNQNQHKLTNIGVYGGVADLFVYHFGKLLFIEVKEPGKGKQRDTQIKFEKHCKDCGIDYYLVYSLEEFKAIIEKTP